MRFSRALKTNRGVVMPLKRVLVCGVFDILHPGHLDFFQKARKHGSHLTVLIARNPNVHKAKGRRPYFNERERAQMVGGLRIVDKVVFGHPRDLVQGVLNVRPDVLVFGYDQRKSAGRLLGLKENASQQEIEDLFEERGLTLNVVLLQRGLRTLKYKSSKIRKRCQENERVLAWVK